MSIFHTHLFYPSPKDPSILWCRCGQSRDIHRHDWVFHADIKAQNGEQVAGQISKCTTCGELKNHYFWHVNTNI